LYQSARAGATGVSRLQDRQAMTLPGMRGLPLRVFARELLDEVRENALLDVAAQLAFNATLALFPFAIFVVTVLGFLPLRGVLDRVLELLHHVVPPEAAPLLDQTVRGVVRTRNLRLLLAGLVGSIWAASGGVASLTTALNRAYGVRESRPWLLVRAQSLAITLLVTVLVVMAVAAMIVGPTWVERASAELGLGRGPAVVWWWLRWPSIVVTMALLLGILYWACPDVRQRLRLVTPGSVTAIPLWIALSSLFNVYVGRFGTFNRTYGALGAGVVLMLWIYLTGLVVLVGGAINAIVARHSPEGASVHAGRGRRRGRSQAAPAPDARPTPA
jgi:membrane protein